MSILSRHWVRQVHNCTYYDFIKKNIFKIFMGSISNVILKLLEVNLLVLNTPLTFVSPY